jgi:predicted  nucleic acid-binding Zn-ribbon protein/Zn-dependent protease
MPKGIYECVRCGHREEFDSNEPVLEGACPECGGDMVLVGFSLQEGETPVHEERALPSEVAKTLERFYSLEFIGIDGNVFLYEVKDVVDGDFEELLRELEELGYWAALKKRDGRRVLFVFPAGEVKPDNPWLPWVFLLLTIGTTLFAGYVQAVLYISLLDQYGLPGLRNPYLIAVAFSISVMAILGTHEMGHKIAALYHNVKATVPYFIPFPNIIGTLGAVIRVKSPLPTRDAAIDLGVSGPIAGFIVAIPVTLIGLKLSVALPQSAIPPSEKGIVLGTNLFFYLLEKFTVNVPEGYVLYLHPVAMAGWIGILVTFLNLIPAAQLDGGHIARALMSERAHRYFTMALAFTMLLMSVLWVGWMIWGLLVLLMGSAGNPGALDEVTPISKKRVLLVIIAVLIFILSATPVPFSTS